MSIRVMSAVWSNDRYEAGALLLLLALADFADDQGYCFPSIQALAKKSRLSSRQVNYILARFKADGAVVVEAGGGRGKPNRYRINPAKFSVKSGMETLQSATETLKSTTRKPAISDIAIRKNRQEPSKNRHSVATETGGFNSTEIAVALCQPNGWSGRNMISSLEKAIQFQAQQVPESSLEQVGEWLVNSYSKYKAEKGRFAVAPQKYFEQALYRDAAPVSQKSGSLGPNPAEWAQSQMEVQ